MTFALIVNPALLLIHWAQTILVNFSSTSPSSFAELIFVLGLAPDAIAVVDAITASFFAEPLFNNISQNRASASGPLAFGFVDMSLTIVRNALSTAAKNAGSLLNTCWQIEAYLLWSDSKESTYSRGSYNIPNSQSRRPVVYIIEHMETSG